MLYFYTPWKHQKICFPVFSGGIEVKHWWKWVNALKPAHKRYVLEKHVGHTRRCSAKNLLWKTSPKTCNYTKKDFRHVFCVTFVTFVRKAILHNAAPKILSKAWFLYSENNIYKKDTLLNYIFLPYLIKKIT